ncbi:MAG TPA: 3-deoxy-D-manno-octulosonic acid transferase [Sedimentisphaerales bacterium]|nr:3-deoxy-D-manno-octulosonic acid transferase [Sedimentisphaerales bacterium]
MKHLMNLIWCLALAALLPKLLYRRLRFGRYRTGWDQRFGNISRHQPEKKCIWLHAVSVGEVNATKTLVAELRKRLPDCEVVMSVTTDTGFAQAANLYHDIALFYYPYDFSWVVTKALSRVKPAAVILMELEVWPNMVAIAREMNIPVVVANGRLSEKSLPKYRMVKWLTRRMFANITVFLVQTREYAERFIELGAPADRVKVTGSMKYDTAQIADTIEGADIIRRKLSIGPEPLWVAGGTGNGEEAIVLDAYNRVRQSYPDLRLAIVPRKPERFDEAAELITLRGFGLLRYSKMRRQDDRAYLPPQSVMLVDTMGDLRKFYSLATLIFVGRSLVPMGGSDMIEAAALGKCTMFGPHTFNFTHDARMLLEAGGAILVRDAAELAEKVMECLNNKMLAADIASRGREVIRKNQGATQRTVDEIVIVLG